MTRGHAYQLRDILHKASMSLDDEDALKATELFAIWDEAGAYNVDDRVRYQEDLYRCLQAHTAQANWNPVDAPSLWAKVLIPDPEVIPVWEQPSSTNPYMAGDKVHYPDENGPVYVSLIDNNVWEPSTPGTENLWQILLD